jgi:hypothetical protein
VIKAWGDQPPPRRPHTVGPAPRRGPGLVRYDGSVLVPEAALQGRDEFEFAVLEDPETGEWFGEDPENPGSALVALEREDTIPTTPEDGAALERAATIARRLRLELERRAAERYRARALRLARAAAIALPRPEVGELAIDLGRAISGAVPAPARWWRTEGGVSLQTVRADDDPLGWVEEWRSVEEVLVTDGPASREAAEGIIRAILGGSDERPAQIDREVRRAAVECLRGVAPDSWSINTAGGAGGVT